MVVCVVETGVRCLDEVFELLCFPVFALGDKDLLSIFHGGDERGDDVVTDTFDGTAVEKFIDCQFEVVAAFFESGAGCDECGAG